MTGSIWAAPLIADRASGRDNNFNLLRILAALGVLVSHAYPISLGPGAAQPLSGVLSGITLGSVSVMAFFSISGFFITRSFAGRSSLARFFQARILRLFPALAVVLAVTVLVAGMFLTKASQPQFWAAVPEYYLRNISLVSLKYDLPGVFETNVYGPAINGSLWTLNYEVFCYLGVVLCGLMGLLSRPSYFVLVLLPFVGLYVTGILYPLHPRIDGMMTLGLPFAIGMSFWIWRRMIPLSVPLALLGLGLAVLGRETPLFEPLLTLFLSYFIFVIGYASNTALQGYNQLGDYSYGTYVYAFPIQQFVASIGVVSPLSNMALALPATLMCAILSWHFVELPAMRIGMKK